MSKQTETVWALIVTPAEYCHSHEPNPVFVSPPEGKFIIRNVIHHLQETQERGFGPAIGYTLNNDDSDKENDPNAAEVVAQQRTDV